MRPVALFIPCSVDLFLPEIGEATAALLRRAGAEPYCPEGQTCCGQPAFNNGYRDEARRAARNFIERFGEAEAVVSPSGSCACTVKFHYPELFQDDPGWRRRAEELAPRVFELSQYLVDVLGVEDLGAAFAGSVTYHDSCHNLRRLGVADQPRRLLAAVRGARVVRLEQEEFCCGFGGTFANSYPDISEAMVEDKAGHYLATGADLLLVSEPGCLMNIGGYLVRRHPDRPAMHLASFLAGHLEGRA